MNKASLIGICPSDRINDFSDHYCDGILDRVHDIIDRDTNAIATQHTLGNIPDETYETLTAYLNKYAAMLRNEV